MKSKHRRKRFLKNNDGVAAVEFALVMPILITLFLGAVEFSHAITVKRKVVALTSATADLVAQTKTMNTPEMQNVFNASAAILAPYDTASLTVVITSVLIDENGDATVDWSKAYQGGTERSTGSSVSLPANLQFPNSSLIMSESGYDFISVIGKYLTNGVHMGETFYLRPRASPTVVWEN
ncbi:MAG: pilus assembly protein [Fimbriimonadaceae bacterium]|nr:pilus assembly protein [Alphaproteobacteria bacterium]